MHLTQVVPSVFYSDLADAKAFFIDYLGFSILHDDSGGKLCVVVRDATKFLLQVDAELATESPPLFRIETDDIDTLWAELNSKPPRLIHPRFDQGVELREWGAKEFAVLDPHGVAIVFQQWV